VSGVTARAWGADAELLIELDSPGGGGFAVQGLAGATRASVSIVAPGAPSTSARRLRLRPLVEPPGPFDADGLLLITPFRETHPDRTALREFERRIGRAYYDFMLGARHRYAASCSIEAEGLDAPGTCAEVYRIDAATVAEADALDESHEPPDDILAIYRECSTFIVPGSHGRFWLIPDPV